MSAAEVIAWRNLAVIPFIIAVLWFLSVFLCKEWVKDDLRKRICEPLSLRWRPIAWGGSRFTCAFTVIYADLDGRIHKAKCRTHWLRPSVKWERDEIIGRR
jgi:hypothetical protein